MIIKVEQISHEFKKKKQIRMCLDHINFTIYPGQFHCIIGESGKGKSTLLNIVTGMLTPKSGTVYWNEKNIFKDLKESKRIEFLNGKIGYMMQGAALLGNLNVLENILCPIEIAGGKREKKEIEHLLKTLDIWNLRTSYPGELSGGEYKRVSLARIIIAKPEVLIADEPTSSLDQDSAEIVRTILSEYCKNGKSVVVATHDMQFIKDTRIIHKL